METSGALDWPAAGSAAAARFVWAPVAPIGAIAAHVVGGEFWSGRRPHERVDVTSAAARLADVLHYFELQQAGAGRDRAAAFARVGFPP
jgi:hypothetical protein